MRIGTSRPSATTTVAGPSRTDAERSEPLRSSLLVPLETAAGSAIAAPSSHHCIPGSRRAAEAIRDLAPKIAGQDPGSARPERALRPGTQVGRASPCPASTNSALQLLVPPLLQGDVVLGHVGVVEIDQRL